MGLSKRDTVPRPCSRLKMKQLFTTTPMNSNTKIKGIYLHFVHTCVPCSFWASGLDPVSILRTPVIRIIYIYIFILYIYLLSHRIDRSWRSSRWVLVYDTLMEFTHLYDRHKNKLNFLNAEHYNYSLFDAYPECESSSVISTCETTWLEYPPNLSLKNI